MMAYFNVRPRYSSGSPAMVDGPTAAHVANDEHDFYILTRDGVYGPDAKATAERAGLRGAAEWVWERTGYWEVLDLNTGERFARPFTVRHVETPLQQARRYAGIRTRCGLPLERDLPPAGEVVPVGTPGRREWLREERGVDL